MNLQIQGEPCLYYSRVFGVSCTSEASKFLDKHRWIVRGNKAIGWGGEFDGWASRMFCLWAPKREVWFEIWGVIDWSCASVPERYEKLNGEAVTGPLRATTSLAVCTDNSGTRGAKFLPVASGILSVQLSKTGLIHFVVCSPERDGGKLGYEPDTSTVM